MARSFITLPLALTLATLVATGCRTSKAYQDGGAAQGSIVASIAGFEMEDLRSEFFTVSLVCQNDGSERLIRESVQTASLRDLAENKPVDLQFKGRDVLPGAGCYLEGTGSVPQRGGAYPHLLYKNSYNVPADFAAKRDILLYSTVKATVSPERVLRLSLLKLYSFEQPDVTLRFSMSLSGATVENDLRGVDAASLLCGDKSVSAPLDGASLVIRDGQVTGTELRTYWRDLSGRECTELSLLKNGEQIFKGPLARPIAFQGARQASYDLGLATMTSLANGAQAQTPFTRTNQLYCARMSPSAKACLEVVLPVERSYWIAVLQTSRGQYLATPRAGVGELGGAARLTVDQLRSSADYSIYRARASLDKLADLPFDGRFSHDIEAALGLEKVANVEGDLVGVTEVWYHGFLEVPRERLSAAPLPATWFVRVDSENQSTGEKGVVIVSGLEGVLKSTSRATLYTSYLDLVRDQTAGRDLKQAVYAVNGLGRNLTDCQLGWNDYLLRASAFHDGDFDALKGDLAKCRYDVNSPSHMATLDSYDDAGWRLAEHYYQWTWHRVGFE